ncbi:MAG: PorV/PorQ family protein [bacterium]
MRTFGILVLTGACALAGFSSLRVLPGGRESGMGNCGVASGFGPQAMVWNPAATAGIEGFAVRAGYTRWLLDTDQQAVFLARNARYFTVGLGLTSFSAGTFEYREDVPTEEPLGLFRPAEMAVHLNLARSFGSMVDVGLSGRLYYTKVHDQEALGPGVDAGARVRPFEGMTLGVSVVDFARPMAYEREQFQLPVRARLGAAYRRELAGGFELGAAADGSWFFREKRPNVVVGGEFGWGGLVFLRTGYEWLDGFGRPAAGLGLRAAGFSCDYSLTFLNDDFGQAHRFSVAYGR